MGFLLSVANGGSAAFQARDAVAAAVDAPAEGMFLPTIAPFKEALSRGPGALGQP
jgi:hypothetical protein